MRNLWKRTGSVLLLLGMAFTLLCPWGAATADGSALPTRQVSQQEAAQRRRLIILLDASLSMSGYLFNGDGEWVKGTDEEGLRFDTIEGFVNYLRGQKNMSDYEIGYVIFANDVADFESAQTLTETAPDLSRATMEEKSKGPRSERSRTNIAAGLEKAVELATKDGMKNSAVLLFSDGHTDLASKADPNLPNLIRESDEAKARALQQARENDVTIYTILLNDVAQSAQDLEEARTEMKSLSTDESLYYTEIKSKDALKEELFKSLAECVGHTIIIEHDMKIPLDIPFTVPGFGVRSMQISLVDCSFDDLSVVRLTREEDNLKLEKEDLIHPGVSYIEAKSEDHPCKWTLHLESDKVQSVRLRLVSQDDLTVNLTLPGGDALDASKPITAQAMLSAYGATANRAEQYQGFVAELRVQDADSKPIDRIQMEATDAGGFTAQFTPPAPGSYSFSAYVSSAEQTITVTQNNEQRTFPIETINKASEWVTVTFPEGPSKEIPVPVTPDQPVSVPPIKAGEDLNVNLREHVEYPDTNDLTFTLVNAPDGVEVDQAQLDDGRLYVKSFGMENAMFEFNVTNSNGVSAASPLYVEATSVVPPPEENAAPVAEKDTYNVTVTRGKNLSVDVSSLVTDDKDAWADMDCAVSRESGSNNFSAPTKNDPHFVLTKASEDSVYTITVTDSDGLSCSFTLNVQTKAPFPWFLLFLIALIVALLAFWIWRNNRRFYGDIKVTTSVRGKLTEDTQSPTKGACYLSAFQLDDFETEFKLNPGQCVFRPAGNRSIVFTMKRAANVMGGARNQYANPTRKVKIENGCGAASVTFPELPGNVLKIEFVSHEGKGSGNYGSSGGGYSSGYDPNGNNNYSPGYDSGDYASGYDPNAAPHGNSLGDTPTRPVDLHKKRKP